MYPVEIKMSGNPKANMGATNPVLDKIKDKSRGMGVILCLIDKKRICERIWLLFQSSIYNSSSPFSGGGRYKCDLSGFPAFGRFIGEMFLDQLRIG